MIEIDDFPASAATARVIDLGAVQEYVGGTLARIDRPGNKFEVELQFPIARGRDPQVLIARLTRARREGLRVDYPLQDVSQGNPGSPVVDGTDSAGTTLKLRGMAVGYQAKEGYWLSLVDAGGTRYLHQVSALATVDGAGKAVLTVEPPLRVFPGDGWVVELGRPKVEGLVLSATEWGMTPGGLISGLSVTLREAA